MATTNSLLQKGEVSSTIAGRIIYVLLCGLFAGQTLAFCPTSLKSTIFLSPPRLQYVSDGLPRPYSDVTRCFSWKDADTLQVLDRSEVAEPPSEVDVLPVTTVPTTKNETEDDRMLFAMMALIFVVGSLSSLDRVAMSVALVPMTEEMGYTDSIKGSISSYFSVGYGIGILPSGLLIASLSPRWVMAVGIACWSLGTIATPLAAAQSSIFLLLAARALVGVSESVAIPTVQRLLSNWVPPEKKSIAVATVFAGFQTGTILAYSLSPFLIDQFDNWRYLFYVYGSAGLLYIIPWFLVARDKPSRTEIVETIARPDDGEISIGAALSNAKENLMSAPWQGFLASKGVWAMFFAHAANNWGLYNNLSWTPTFYSEQYGLNVKESAVLLVVPSIVGAIGGLSAGTIADHIIQNLEEKSDKAITNIRKSFQGIALFCPSLCLGALSYSMPEDPAAAQALLALAVGFQSFNAAGYGAANQEKAGEKWTGLLYGITSLPSVVIGTFAVYLTGRILDFTEQNWSIVFGLNALVYFLGAVTFVALYDSKKEFD